MLNTTQHCLGHNNTQIMLGQHNSSQCQLEGGATVAGDVILVQQVWGVTIINSHFFFETCSLVSG